jgi:CheY-like chemotaxis protein/PAS domain-containing protein
LERTDFEIWTAADVARLLTLVENEKRYYQELLLVAPVPMAVVGRDLTLQSMNKAFRSRFQIRQADMVQSRLTDWMPAAIIEERMQQAFAQNAPVLGISLTAWTPEGVGRPCRLSIVPLPNPYAAQSEEALVVAEEPELAGSQTAVVLDEQLAVAWELEPSSGEVRLFNSAAGGLIGPGGAKAWAKRVHPEDHARVAWVYEAVLESGIDATVDYRLQRPDGTTRWLSDRVFPVLEGGRPVRLHLLTTEIDARRARLQQLLETRQVEAGMRLSQRISHEFNNLWMIVTGYTEVLQQQIPESDTETRSLIEEIDRAARRGSTVTQQLLQFARPGAGHAAIVDLHDVLRGWEFDVDRRLAAGPAPVSVDAGRFRTALSALAEHAIGTLSVGQRLSVETGRRMVVSDFADAMPQGSFVTLKLGPVRGVSGNRLSHWNEPFFSDADKPAGIGLAPVFSQLRQLGVSCSLERTRDEEAVYVLQLPLARLPEPEKPRPATSGSTTVSSAPATVVPTRERLLVVDADESVRNLIVRSLSREGYAIQTAATCEEAAHLLESETLAFDLLVCDLTMPGLHCEEVAAHVRALRPRFPVLFLSGFSEVPALPDRDLSDNEEFLRKPFSLAALAQAVRTVLDRVKD